MGDRRGFGTKHDVHAQKWENSDFPILCDRCLGTNKFIRMTKADWEKECRICTTPVTVFRWKPNDSQFKQTEICQTCAKVKNVCSSCLFDLKYGLPMEIRDRFLKNAIEIPKEAINRDFWAFLNNKNIDTLQLPYDKEDAHPILEKLAEQEKSVKKSPLICSYYVKGICAKGEACPYRHEIPDVAKLTDDEIRERFVGTKDPVSKKIMRQYATDMLPNVPLDKRVTTLCINGFADDSLKEKDFSKMFTRFGEVKAVKIDISKFYVLITFKRRDAAESAMQEMFNNLEIKGQRYKLIWGRTGNENKASLLKKERKEANVSTYKTAADKESKVSKKEFFFGDLSKPLSYASLDEDVVGGYEQSLLGMKKLN